MAGAVNVFISYAHADSFELAQRLHASLLDHGHDVWMDVHRLTAGIDWSTEIERRLDEASTVLALLSAGSYVSEICRAEQLRSLRHKKCVLPVFVQPNVEQPIYLEAKHCLDFSDPTRYEAQLGRLLEDIASHNGATLPERNRKTYVTAPPLPLSYVERPAALAALRSAILGEGTTRRVALTAVRGMGGIGKTILAQALCHDELVQAAFPDGVIWISIGQEGRDPVGQMREVAKALGDPLDRYDTIDASANQLRTTLRSKSVLLVLDDVWDVRHVEPFRVDAPCCRLLVTTRDARIAAALGADEYPLEGLTRDESLRLLASWSQQPVEELPPESVDVVLECGYLPLALAMIGAMVRGKPEKWMNLLTKLRNADLGKIQQQFPNYPHPTLLRAIEVSVEALDPDIRNYYLDFAIFPEDTPIPEATLETYWSRDRYGVQDVTDQLVDLSLATRNAARAISLHDLQFDYVRRITGTEAQAEMHQRLLYGYADLCSSGWPSGPNDGYFFRHLTRHLVPAGHRDELRELLLDFDWLQAKLVATDPGAILDDFRSFSNDSDLDLVQGAIRLSSHVVREDNRQFASQLVGRLLHASSPVIRVLLSQAARSAQGPWLRPLTGGLVPPGAPLVRTLMVRRSGKMKRKSIEDGKRPLSAVMSSDGRRGLSLYHGSCRVWDLDSGLELAFASGVREDVTAAALDITGQRALTSHRDNSLRVWDLESGSLLRLLAGHAAAVECVAATRDFRVAISSSRDRTMRVWDLVKGVELRCLTITSDCSALAIDLHGRRALSYSEDRILRVWDIENGIELLRSQPISPGMGVSLSGDGGFAFCACADGTVRGFDVVQRSGLPHFMGHEGRVRSLALSVDAKVVVSASDDCTVRVWDVRRRVLARTMRGHSAAVTSISLSDDSRRALSASADGSLKLWNLDSTEQERTPPAHASAVTGVAITPDGSKAISSSADGGLILWEPRRGAAVVNLASITGGTGLAAISADGNVVLSGTKNGSLVVRRTGGSTEQLAIPAHSAAITAVGLSWDGRFAISASADCTVKLWDLLTGDCLKVLTGHSATVVAADISADGRIAASGSVTGLKIWDLRTGELLRTFMQNGIRSVSISRAGERVAANVGNWVSCWNLSTNAGAERLQHKAGIRGVDLGDDGRMLASVADQTLRVWNTDTCEVIAQFTADGQLSSCAMSEVDAGLIICGEATGTVHLLRLEGYQMGEAISYEGLSVSPFPSALRNPNDTGGVIQGGKTADSTR